MDFTRSRVLTLEHVIGLTLSLAASRNANGYDISSQNYFRDLRARLGETLEPARHQSISEARSKLSWQAFEYLLGKANLENQRLPGRLKFRGHLTRAIDGTSFYTPRTDELLEYFSPRATCSEEGETHYPYGLMVSAVNVYTAQAVAAQVGDHLDSERDLLLRLLDSFEPGDLSLLDRGLGGARIYLEFEQRGQLFIHRAQTTGKHGLPSYVRSFIESGKNQEVVEILVWDKKHKRCEGQVKIRLVRGPDDPDGKPIVFATNLLKQNRYPRQEILGLYRKRWSVETHYGRVKHLLCLEKFHARSYNGVMQEIFANLLILSLTALAVTAVIIEDKVDTEVELPSFKNASESIRRHLFAVIDRRIEGVRPKKLMKQILAEVRAVMYPIRPGRSYPRVSRQPIQPWNLKKSAKLRTFAARQKTARGPLRRVKSNPSTRQGS